MQPANSACASERYKHQRRRSSQSHSAYVAASPPSAKRTEAFRSASDRAPASDAAADSRGASRARRDWPAGTRVSAAARVSANAERWIAAVLRGVPPPAACAATSLLRARRLLIAAIGVLLPLTETVRFTCCSSALWGESHACSAASASCAHPRVVWSGNMWIAYCC